MGTTPNFQYRYPDPSSTVDVARDVKNLALDVDGKNKIMDNTLQGIVPSFTTVSTGFIPQIGWAISQASGQIFTLGVVKLGLIRVGMTRTGAGLASAATGQVADEPMVQVPDSLMPKYSVWSNFSTNGISGSCYLTIASKMLVIADFYPSQTIATNAVVSTTMFYSLN